VSDSFLRLADVQRRVPFSCSTIYLMISRASSQSRSVSEPAP
jgi:predicted DNA-binding transcriptional regulator AlpA